MSPSHRTLRRARLAAVAVTLFAASARADKGNGVSAGLILQQDTSARAAALAGTVESVANDVGAMGYNPASLASLDSNHVVVGFQRGLVDDSFSQIQFGHPLRNAGFGVSLSLYQGGKMDFIEGGIKQKSVVSERDMAGAVGYAHYVGRFGLGASLKYLSSELAETEKASTAGVDLGATADLGGRFRLAAAAQNLGASLKYGSEKSDVTQTLRAGFSYLLIPAQRNQTTLLVDFPYLVHESRVDAAAGLETLIGPIALRAGYRTGIDLGGLTLGAGFALSRFSLDYAFGLVQDLQSSHRVSLSYRFGAIARDTSMVTIGAPYRTTPAAGNRKSYETTVQREEKLPKKKGVALSMPERSGEKISEPVPVYQGVGRSNCGDGSGNAGVIYYGKGRADCGGGALPPMDPEFLKESKPTNGGEAK